jgi:tetratricopeptide (TPR) repeat protein
MALSEIEKLERRYAENPQGLTFAPLAEVHRKNGDAARALDLLRPGLELHPDYIPARIVLGRCHLDLGDLPAAEAAFTHVLALDGENVIALKALADLSERLRHFDQAERWLNTLLSVDRSNDDARAQLERIDVARRDAAAAPVPPEIATETEPAAVAGTGEAPAEAAGAPAEESAPPPSAEPRPAWSTEAQFPEADESVPLALEDLEPTLTADDIIEPPPPGLEVEEPEILVPPVEPLAGLIGRDVDEGTPEGSEFRVELSEDIVLRSSGGHEFQMPDAAHELSARTPPPLTSPFGEEPAAGFGALEAPPLAPPPPMTPPVEATLVMPALAPPEPSAPGAVAIPAAGAPTPEPESERETVPEPAPRAAEPVADLVVPPEPELVVTETMAEVLLQQGHSAEALRVYRELEVRNAGDARLLQKIAELEVASLPVPPEPAPPEPEPARRQYTAADTGGQSVGDYLRALLAARPPAAPAGAARAPAPPLVPPERSGAPTRPAADALSLSSVFGEESTPLPPAVPTPPAPAQGVSFDEFYSPPSSGGASPKTRAPDPKSDDLDQFHAWLQNLKR